MAGSIPLSLTQQFDSQSKVLAGGRLYSFQAGTTTPQSAYQDSALTIPHPNPTILDAAGRIPQLFYADGSIKIRLDSQTGVTQLAADGILVIGASSGGGGGSPVDATTVLQTGDLKVRYGTGVHTGWVRANGRTIGSVTSGGTERSNADTEALFLYLWGADANLTVSTGRGASAAADWAANKNIALPDWRGRAIAALDDMGSTPASRLSGTYFGALATVLGAAGGLESHQITIPELANHGHNVNDPTHTHTALVGDPSHTHAGTTGVGTGARGDIQIGGILLTPIGQGGSVTAAVTGITVSNVAAATGVTVAAAGGGAAHNNVQPTMLATIYVKL